MHQFILTNKWALGDTVCLSALVRDIQRAYPKQYEVFLTGHYQSHWNNNPYCRLLKKGDRGQLIELEYHSGIKASNNKGVQKHFLSYFHESFRQKTSVTVPVTEPKGDIHLSDIEKKAKFPGRYWVVNAGGKLDMTVKVWETSRYQAVVDRLADQGIQCIQIGHDFNRHFHPRLKNCISAIGQTESIRDLYSLIYNCDGVICGITGVMHIAAAFDKPCVVIAGGREAPWWEGYVNAYYPTAFGPTCAPVKVEHRYLHTIGLLDCGIGNLDKGCWKDRTVPLDQSDHTNQKKIQQLCRRPIRLVDQTVPECMQLVTVDHVMEAVMGYYKDGFVPPIGLTKLSVPSPPAWSEVLVYHDKLHPREVPVNPPEHPALKLLDHPYIGGKFTVCVLCYGDHFDLAKRCIDSIINNSSINRLDLRIACNQVCARTLDYINGLKLPLKCYVDDGTRLKYAAMREMFHDPEYPITTPYALWFDDDSHVVDANWLALLANEIIVNHPHGVRMFGCKYLHDIMTFKRQGYNPENWFRAASWWKGRNLRLTDGKREGGNGSVIEFASGGFWALATEVIQKADIPDVRLVHSGGDVTIGEQVHQAGFKIKDFCRGKKPVAWSDAKPRGASHKGPKPKEFPWSRYL